MLILAFLFRALLNPAEIIALHYAECKILTYPMDDGVVAVKWSCPS